MGAPLDGEWGNWASWQGCSVTCGSGVRRRYRGCDDPAPAYGGQTCVGDSYEEAGCSAGTNCAGKVKGRITLN